MSVSRTSRLAVDLIAFDMGGTTVRDEGVVPHAFRQALQPLGIEAEELAAQDIGPVAAPAATATNNSDSL